MTHLSLDDAIVEAYVDLDIPSDQLLNNSTYFLDFESRVTLCCRPSELVNSDELKRRLINLRKSGKLPRIRKVVHTPRPGFGRPKKVQP